MNDGARPLPVIAPGAISQGKYPWRRIRVKAPSRNASSRGAGTGKRAGGLPGDLPDHPRPAAGGGPSGSYRFPLRRVRPAPTL